MKNFNILILILFSCISYSQITEGEYFFNEDPGFNNGTLFTVNEQNGSFTKELNLPINNLQDGFNTFYARVNQNGNWSTYTRTLFYKSSNISNNESIKNIKQAEYFFDNDPGIGNGTEITITEGTSFTSTFTIDISSLTDGFHTVYIRCKTSENLWSVYERSLFYISKNTNSPLNSLPINYAEYFFDSDPGLGNGTSISLNTNSTTVNETISIDTEGLEGGFHTVYIRVRNTNNDWSTYDRSLFYVSENTNSSLNPLPINYAEYFFDSDPGLGNGTSIPLDNNSTTVNQTISIGTGNIESGFHTVYLRVRNTNNQWSTFDRSLFYKSETNQTVEDGAITEAEYYFNEFVDFNQGNKITLEENNDGNFETEINTQGLTEGEHLLFIRAKNDKGTWGLHDVVAFTIDNSLSVNDIEKTTISIYPNPVMNFLNISTSQEIENVTIYNLLGKKEINIKSNNTVNVSKLSSGIYFCVIDTINGKTVKKIVKK